MKKTQLLLIAVLTTTILSQSPNPRAHDKEHKVYPHSRLHIYNFPSPATERVDKSLNPTSLRANYFNIVQTCTKRNKERAMKEKLKYDYEGDKNAIALRWLPGMDDQDKLMELSFHFGQEVEDHFLEKFQAFYNFLTKEGDSDYKPEKLEITYGFSLERAPVVFQVWKTTFAQDGQENRVKIFEDMKGEQTGLGYILDNTDTKGIPDSHIEVKSNPFNFLDVDPEQKILEI